MAKARPQPVGPEFEDCALKDIYMHELYIHATNIVRKSDSLFEQNQVEPDNYFKVDVEIHSLISSILADASAAKSLLADYDRKQSGRVNALRVKRTRHLLDALAGIDFPTIMDKSVRNSMEHFDEYLDKANVALFDQGKTGRPAIYNMVLSRRDFVPALRNPYPIKMYIAEEKIFENLETKIDMGALRAEAQNIAERLQRLLNINDESPGAYILFL